SSLLKNRISGHAKKWPMALRAIAARHAKWRQRPVYFRPTSPSFNHAHGRLRVRGTRAHFRIAVHTRQPYLIVMRNLIVILAFTASGLAVTPPAEIKVPAGFKVELLREAGPREGSWICMAI